MALKKKEYKARFVKLGEKGDIFQGVFLESQERKNRLSDNDQTVWLVVATAEEGKCVVDKKVEKIKKGEHYMIGEKSAMTNLRVDLDKGQEFRVECLGKVKGDAGREYTDFDFYLDD